MSPRHAALAALLGLTLASAPAFAAEEQAYVAKVNGEPITTTEFDRNWKGFLQQKGVPSSHTDQSGTKMEPLRKELLDIMIDNELLWQEAKKKKLVADTTAVDEQLAQVRKQYPDQATWEKVLGSNGLTEKAFRAIIEQRLGVARLINEEIVKKPEISDKEIADYYEANKKQYETPEQVSASHILIKVDPSAEPAVKDAARKKIDGLLEDAKKEGADFAELAKANSECPSAAKGGDLGSFTRGRMVKPFEDAAFALAPGQVSGVVETQFGFHIIKLGEKTAGGSTSLQDATDRIKQVLHAEKGQKMIEARLKELKEKAKIEIKL